MKYAGRWMNLLTQLKAMYTDRRTQMSTMAKAMYHANKCQRIIDECKPKKELSVKEVIDSRELTIDDMRTLQRVIPHTLKSDIVVRELHNIKAGDDRFISIKQACEVCRCSDDLIRKLIGEGRITSILLEGIMYIDRQPGDDASVIDRVISLQRAKDVCGLSTLYISRKAILNKRFILKIGRRNYIEKSFIDELTMENDNRIERKNKRLPKKYANRK